MNAFINGILMGFGVSVPIGPINVLIMSYALQSYTKALCLGLGAMSADMVYLALSAFGISQLAKIPLVFAIISVFGACFLTYIAYGIYKSARNTPEIKSVELGSHAKIYSKGFFLNLLNPYVIMFWLSVSASVSSENFALSLLGLFVAILSWITLFPLVIYKNRARLPDSVARAFAYISTAILVFYAAKLLWGVVKNLIA
ncbi:LysE family translocator [Campylobacter sp. VBCF_07 NA4]|uniref:LysE family translocator n=1 Tax=Campylobacter sp. VBCF_07 NA4 TaxID=2983835 RepID=UPI0022E9BA25|nr:LysE family translocator [Campylobacter sp. VBCF_07 NA4]MDA3054991.1 LysE family translocator [Campylobacter sp. VBCF_07 NA4]